MRGYIAGEMGWYLMKRFLCYVKKFKLYLIYKTRPVKTVRQGRNIIILVLDGISDTSWEVSQAIN